jgi:hypothetical protein
MATVGSVMSALSRDFMGYEIFSSRNNGAGRSTSGQIGRRLPKRNLLCGQRTRQEIRYS